ncbi:MAG: hypothetical protein AB7O29_14835, partial [Acidimicrobiia bacterium]
ASVVAAQHVPWVLVHLAGQAGTYDRRTLVGLADTARAVAVGILGILTLTNAETMLAIQLVAFVVGVGEAWTDRIESESSSPGSLSTRGMLAVGLVGFPLGGLLYEVSPGPATPLLADVLVFTVASTLALAIRSAVRPRPEPRRAPTRPGHPLMSGGGPLPSAAVALLASSAVASFAASGLLGLLVLFATADLGLGAPAFGLLLAGLAVSTALGGLAAPLVGELVGVRTGVAAGQVVAGGAVAAAALLADPGRPWPAIVALGAGAAAGMAATVLGRARLQLVAGPRGTAAALHLLHLVTWAAIPAGALVAGLAARHTPVDRVLVGTGGAWLLAAVAVLAVRRSSAGRAPTAGKVPVREIV